MKRLYSACIKSGHFPEKWKIAKFLMVAKPGREEDSDPSMFRPIRLMNTEGKILEKLLLEIIMHHLCKTDALNGSLY